MTFKLPFLVVVALCVASAAVARELKDVAPPVRRAGPDGCVYTVINSFVSYGPSICDSPTGCRFDNAPTAEECELFCTQEAACAAFHFDLNAPSGVPRCVLLSSMGTARRGLPGNTVGIKRGSTDGSC